MVDYAQTYGLRTVAFRQSCIYGEHQLGVEDQGWVAWFVLALQADRPITVFGDGKQVRDLLHVDDLLRCFTAAVARIDEVSGQVFNVGGGSENSPSVWWQLAPLLTELFGRNLPDPAFGPWRLGDQLVFVSDLTIYVERLARELAARGHEVTVLTSRHDRSLPRVEWQDGVRVVRVPVWFRISQGVVMPMPLWAARLARSSDVVSIHLPQFDGGFVAAVARLLRRRVVLIYHCDLRLPRGVVNRLADAVTYAMNYLAGRCPHGIVAYTADYATHSSLLKRFPDKIDVIPPPVVVDSPDPIARRRMRDEWQAGDGPIIGIAARLATEKGVEFVVGAMPRILELHPDARVVFAGPHVDVVGEDHYRQSLEPDLRALGDRWRFLGVLDPGEMVDFFGAIDLLVVSSINGTESFGLVQVEAMPCGTPVIATDLPGVRQPVAMTGMGLVVPPRDSDAIADAVDRIVTAGAQFQRSRASIEERFDLRSTVDAYELLFQPS